MTNKLTHIDAHGNARMVDIGQKPATERIAIAQACVILSQETLKLLQTDSLPKGDALACARIGAILAAKRTAELIPLCHTLPLTHVDIDFEIENTTIRILAQARCTGKTGVEMEAIIAAQTAAAIIYDMCKAVQRDIIISDIRLLYKTGGKSGTFTAPGFTPPKQSQ